MKSKLFQSGISDEVKKHLKVLAELPADPIKELIDILDKHSKDSLPTIEKDDLLSISEKYQIIAKDLSNGVGVAIFLHSQIKRYKDSIDDFISDIRTEKIANEKEIDSIKEKLLFIKPIFDAKIEGLRYLQQNLSATFPILNHFHTRCSVVAHFEPILDRKMDPNKYEPKVSNITPITLLQIDIEKYGDIERFGFAVTRDELEDFIKHLQLALVQLKKLNKSLTN